jgi:hypothetical protein
MISCVVKMVDNGSIIEMHEFGADGRRESSSCGESGNDQPITNGAVAANQRALDGDGASIS